MEPLEWMIQQILFVSIDASRYIDMRRKLWRTKAGWIIVEGALAPHVLSNLGEN